MHPEKDLSKLLKTMKPLLNEGAYVFCTTKDLISIESDQILMLFKEAEGYTIILKKEYADSLKLNYTFIASWITLTVHSALEAVGLTAAFAEALAAKDISCNVVAGYYHDHLFVDNKDGEKAMAVLERLSNQHKSLEL